VSTFVFAVLVLGGAALYFMNADERRRLLVTAVVHAREAVRVAKERRENPHDALHALLFERTGRTLVMPLLIVLSVWFSLSVLFGSGEATQTLIASGANYAPRTTHAEWSRLLTYTFVHVSLLHLLATIAVLLPLGMLLERLVGHLTFAAVYVAAGVVAGALTLRTTPATTVSAGASGAVFGLIGLLIAVTAHGYLRTPKLPFSRIAAKRLAVGCAVFAAYNLLSDSLGTTAEMAGLVTGLLTGLVVGGRVASDTPALPLTLAATVTTVVLAVTAALPLSGTIDARPELARIADVESRTASEYAKAVEQYTRGRMSASALVQVIERSIIPAIKADRTRVDALHGVPAEQAPLVVDAREYFELREASWRTRIGGLLASKARDLKEAEKTERAALKALDKLQQEVSAPPLS
jgi:membrane associated rhomboid family serine protease